jgi:GH25 family lysozyme M1 (1,4-beta-N-acetylmuramidase)
MIHGFDVSAFQDNSVPRADFIFIKATEGRSYKSSKFAAQWADAKRHGMLRGAYHFARPEDSSASAQADRLIDAAEAEPGELLCLDVEASDLSQGKTNAWVKDFGDRLRAKAPGVTTVVYLGGRYASSRTGKGLSEHFDFWWYPQYPRSFLRAVRAAAVLRRRHPRSAEAPRRVPVGHKTSKWPSSFSPRLPSGLTTGWRRPHIWQFTDDFDGLDANISALSRDRLAGGKDDGS